MSCYRQHQRTVRRGELSSAGCPLHPQWGFRPHPPRPLLLAKEKGGYERHIKGGHLPWTLRRGRSPLHPPDGWTRLRPRRGRVSPAPTIGGLRPHPPRPPSPSKEKGGYERHIKGGHLPWDPPAGAQPPAPPDGWTRLRPRQGQGVPCTHNGGLRPHPPDPLLLARRRGDMKGIPREDTSLGPSGKGASPSALPRYRDPSRGCPPLEPPSRGAGLPPHSPGEEAGAGEMGTALLEPGSGGGVAGDPGFEPGLTDPESVVLPLD